MTTAAEMLLITQPAISRLVRDLELELKIQLFHRKGNQITPTAEATSFFAEIERSYLGLDQLRSYASDLRRSITGSLHVAAMPALAFGFLPYCLSAFAADRPKLSILLDGMPSHTVVERVLGGQFEIGFAEVPTGRPTLDQTPIRANAAVVMPSGHPLSRFDSLSAQQLVDERIIMLGRGSYTRHTIERALGVLPRHPAVIETSLAGIACALVARGMGVTIVDPFAAMTFLSQGLVARPLRPSLDVGFFMLTARSRPISKLAVEFAGTIQEHADDFLADLYAR
ncbi:DNA-binding transcriptional LysR family regulator [Rhizobium aethiopicum]|uniref:LysR substrate-binding domain-containing protein n=1 Tax=Rhizobium aethiopicum TaxID=1138170 RepID=UPI00181A9547|nr:LysR substrate-binding domain-containing protein [Rhizobium aethiopicum]MBB4581622.1 DNA-binding transcriptional LysR family regulator [Rhizobium aethiopicum]